MAYSRKIELRKLPSVKGWEKGREGQTAHRNRAAEKRDWMVGKLYEIETRRHDA